MTPKQASRALAALDGLVYRVGLYAEVANIKLPDTVWEREAIWRLRGHLIAMLPDNDPQLTTESALEGRSK